MLWRSGQRIRSRVTYKYVVYGFVVITRSCFYDEKVLQFWFSALRLYFRHESTIHHLYKHRQDRPSQAEATRIQLITSQMYPHATLRAHILSEHPALPPSEERSGQTPQELRVQTLPWNLGQFYHSVIYVCATDMPSTETGPLALSISSRRIVAILLAVCL
jgi:hypothetical protein